MCPGEEKMEEEETKMEEKWRKLNWNIVEMRKEGRRKGRASAK